MESLRLRRSKVAQFGWDDVCPSLSLENATPDIDFFYTDKDETALPLNVSTSTHDGHGQTHLS